MKSVITLIFILMFGGIALANTEINDKVDDIKMGVFLGGSIERSNAAPQIEVDTENGVARLYKFRNSRVKKALTFTGKHSKSKLV